MGMRGRQELLTRFNKEIWLFQMKKIYDSI
jgi:hypothetical protein